jgi:hypothetical protein
MATLERLREVAQLATEHWKWSEQHRRPGAAEAAHFRFYEHGLNLWINPVLVPLTPLHKQAGIAPWVRWNEPSPTHGADFEFYQRLLKHIESVGYWVSHDHGSIGYSRTRFTHANEHAAGRSGSKLRLLLKVEANGQIELSAFQDGLMGPGRTNGARWSIETKNYQSLSPRERLHWRHVRWSVKRWLEAQGFLDRSERRFEDPEEEIEWRVRQSWHFKDEETIYTPRKLEPYNDRDANGKRIVNGDVKAFRDYFTRRMVVGKVFQNINNMWWACSGGRVLNLGSGQIRDWDPRFARRENRRWMPDSDRLERLKRVQANLVAGEKFERAAKVRDVIRSLERSIELARAHAAASKAAPARMESSL